MSEKQPLVSSEQQPTAPPPPYQGPSQLPPTYATPYKPPPQGGYQAAPSNTGVYIQPQQQTRTVLVEYKPPNYIVLSIITMFFCWVFGLLGLIMGMKVDSLWLSGNREEAVRCSRQARLYNVIGMVTGVVLYVVVVVLSVGVNIAASS